MSPNGTLLAYSTPANIKELRDQATLISMAWKDHLNIAGGSKGKQPSHSADPSSGSSAAQISLKTLTIEFDHANLIVRAVQSSLLLVLVGDVPSGKSGVFKMTAERDGDERYPTDEMRNVHVDEKEGERDEEQGRGDEGKDRDQEEEGEGAGEGAVGGERREDGNALQSPTTSSSSREKRKKSQMREALDVGYLHVQRAKLDAVAEFVRRDFEAKGFVMPNFP